MGVLSMLLGKDHAASKWAAENRGWKGAIGAGLASGPTFEQGLANAAQMGPAGQQADDAYAASEAAKAERLAQINETVAIVGKTFPPLGEAIKAGMPLDVAWNEYLKRSQPGYGQMDPTANMRDFQMSQDNPGYADFLQQDGSGPKTGFTPIPGMMDDKPAIALPGNDGRLYINGQPVDPSKFIPTNPYDLNAQRGGGLAFGKATGAAQFSIPNAQGELDQSNAAISNLKTDPKVVAGMEDWFKQWGALPRGMWVQGGSNMAQFQNSANNVIDRSWLSARAALKGGGQITDYEGAKAENAVSMMKAALNSGDKAQFEAARDDYEYWIQQGFTKLQQQAGAMTGYGGGGAAAPAGGGNYVFNPATGKLEPQ